jgi:hypothetical protein
MFGIRLSYSAARTSEEREGGREREGERKREREHD